MLKTFFSLVLMGFAGLGTLGLVWQSFAGPVPAAGDWVPVIVFGGIGGWLFRRANRKPSAEEVARLARFVPLSLPVPLGGELAGMIVVPRTFTQTANGRVTLSCWRLILREEYRKGRTRTRVHHELVGETTERILRSENWERTAGGAQAVILLPVRGGAATVPEEPRLDHPTIEWLLTLEMPAAEGALSCEFAVPVYPKPGDEVKPEATPGEVDTATDDPRALAESVAAMVEPASSPPESPTEQLAALENAAIVRQPQPGATGGEALVMDAAAAQTAGRLAWVGMLVVVGIVGIFGMLSLFLFAIPLLGLVLGPAALLGLAFLVLNSLRDTLRKNSGPETVWVEGDGIRVMDRNGKTVEIPRSAVARIEVIWGGTVGTAQYFEVAAAGNPAPGKTRRSRERIVSAVRSREAARAVGHWLAERLGSPPVPVANAERGVALLEWFLDWKGKGRAG